MAVPGLASWGAMARARAAWPRRRGGGGLAVEGYLALRERVLESGPGALDDFYAAALRLAGQRADDWRDRWQAGALATAELTGDHLDEISAGVAGAPGRGRPVADRAPRGRAELRDVRPAHHLPGRAGRARRLSLASIRARSLLTVVVT